MSTTPPPLLREILEAGRRFDFSMPSDQEAGSLLRVLAAAKPGGNFLELGTGLGLSLAWLRDGADENATITSLDNEPRYVDFAAECFAFDKRVNVVCADGAQWLDDYRGTGFDLIFADTWPGKYHHLEPALQLLKPGGLYVIDDMLPQDNWPEGHADKASALLERLATHPLLITCRLDWSTGVLIAVRRG